MSLYNLNIHHIKAEKDDNFEREAELFEDKEELLYKLERLQDLRELIELKDLELPIVVDETGTFYEVREIENNKTQQ